MNYSPLVLIIDDEVAILQTLKEALVDEGFRVQTLSDGNKALSLVGDLIPDIILLDVFMPNCNGLDLLLKIKKEYPAQKVIIISGFGNIPLAIDAVKKGALDFIEKPFNLDDIFSKLSFLKTDSKPTKQIYSQDPNFAEPADFGIVGQSFLFFELMTQVNNLAHLKFPLLIYGEHGTGKTLISKFIHQTGPLKNKQFNVIDCLTQSFGDIDLSGTVCVKNIDKLSSDDQNKFLKLLESSQFKQRNNDGELKLITTSCRPLFGLVRADKFNRALFYKLNITPIEIASINKRRYDIPLLLNYYLNYFNQVHNKNIVLDAVCVRYLRNRHWIENITELKNLVEKIVLTSSYGSKLSVHELNKFISERDIEFVEEQDFLSFNSLEDAIKTFEKKYLSYVFKKSNFDLQQASEKLNLSVSYLSEKLSELKIK
jgi:DNA-binding NtrC family response regulator